MVSRSANSASGHKSTIGTHMLRSHACQPPVGHRRAGASATGAGLGARLRSADYDREGRKGLVALLVPTEDPQRAQRVPPAGLSIAVLEREGDRGVGLFHKPHALQL